MSKLIRLILAIAFAIFVIAIIWALVVNHRHKKAATNNPASNPTTMIGQPATATNSPAAAPAPASPAAPAAATKPAPTRARRIVITKTTDEDFSDSASASASAGSSADGSTWANAEAN